jgi:muconolactone delta-isomerase
MTLNYYVYYRIPADHVERARMAVEAMQRDLAARTGIQGRLLRRRDDAATWMEVYDDVSDGPQLEQALAALVEQHGLAALLVPGTNRRQEVFRPL